MNICFPAFFKAETAFDIAHDLFILNKKTKPSAIHSKGA